MIDINITGLVELEKRLKAAPKEIPLAEKRACILGGLIFEKRAKWYASGNAGGPKVQTGNLRASIFVTELPNGVIVGPHVEYAPYLEYGTNRRGLRPFMRPAFEDEKERAKKLMQDSLKKDLVGRESYRPSKFEDILPED